MIDKDKLPPAQPECEPSVLRPLTDEEKKSHPGVDFILDCRIPYGVKQILMKIEYK